MELQENRTPVYIALLMVIFLLVALNLENVHLNYSAVPVKKYHEELQPLGPGVKYMNGTIIVFGIEIAFYAVAIIGIIILALKYGKKFLIQILRDLVIGMVVAGGIGLILGYGINIARGTNGGSHMGSAWDIMAAPVLFYLAVSLFFIIIAVVIAKSVHPKKKNEIPQENISKYVERAISTIKIGGDVKGAILRAYKEMENMMRARGVEDKEYFTPREFKEFALNNLRLSPAPVNTLVSLFEIARYSQHSMEEEQRERALRALEEIKDEIQKNSD